MAISEIQYFSNQPAVVDIPTFCRNPFDNNPHSLAVKASKELQQRLINKPSLSSSLFNPAGGKMFGVLVVADNAGKIGYLSSFSGMLNKQWNEPGFVPPVFNTQQQQAFLDRGEAQLAELTEDIEQRRSSVARLSILQKLKDFEQQQVMDVDALKEQHKKNKKNRRLSRLKFNANESNEKALMTLSFLSQQDKRELKQCKKVWNEKTIAVQLQLKNDHDDIITILQSERKKRSQDLHKKVFDGYRLVNPLGQKKPLVDFFNGQIPAGGTGDCAGPKLLQFAHKNKLKILAMAEFWWGAPPVKSVRHHAHFYPPCRGKCFPILPFMLTGVVAKQKNLAGSVKPLEPEIVFEDDSLLVINKPAGLLSIPGKEQSYSVLSWLKQYYPEATGALLVHRLDMDTSGLLLAAKSSQVYKHLQKQFIQRSIKKRYVAVLSKKIRDKNKIMVNLPLRVDLDDRPRQIVCDEYGKQAVTYVTVISSDKSSSRVYFYPVTGRTHQLRVHAAHPQGLNAPIIGDALYGARSDRMLLHAEKITFEHPLTGVQIEVKAIAPF